MTICPIWLGNNNVFCRASSHQSWALHNTLPAEKVCMRMLYYAGGTRPSTVDHTQPQEETTVPHSHPFLDSWYTVDKRAETVSYVTL